MHSDDIDIHTHGSVRLDLFEDRIERLAHGHHVAAEDGGDSESNARHAVIAEDGGGRFLITTHDFGHVAQIDQSVRAWPLRTDQKISKLLFGLVLPGRMDCEIVRTEADVTGARRQILGGKGVVDILL